MNQWKSANEILDFAIRNEEEAAKFYNDLAQKMDSPATTALLKDFAKEEIGHRNKLMKVKETGQMEPATEKVTDLKIGDYLVDEDPEGEIDYQRALILAMKAEKAAFRLYSDLAASTEDAGLRDLLLSLAQEEAKHKLRFEIEYDEYVLKEN